MIPRALSFLVGLGCCSLVLASKQSPFIAPSNPFVSNSGPNLIDVLTTHSEASIFHQYLREYPVLYARLSSTLPTTLLVPRNSAILRLNKKPHQALEGEGDDDSSPLLERWLKAHIVDHSVELESVESFKNFLGQEIYFDRKQPGGAFGITQAYQYRLNPGDIEVNDVIAVSNGCKLIVIDGALSIEN